ncbi:MAG TPA: N-acetylmuramoyl-L-alanine amidase, partial [Nonomuraea sp.]|nr:N-acetylmuramoyl-L-alanine amidase [Nonomuraea sp.]
MRALPASILAVCGLIATACGGAGSGGAAPGQAAPARTQQPARQAQAPAAEPTPGDPTPKAAQPLDGKVIVIDPGHNGGNYRNPAAINRQVDVLTQKKACDTTGTQTNSGYTEAAFTWDVSNRLAKLLKRRGATVKLTRSGNTGVGPCITERAAIGNRAKADAAISIHADGSDAAHHGFHVILPKTINGPVDKV